MSCRYARGVSQTGHAACIPFRIFHGGLIFDVRETGSAPNLSASNLVSLLLSQRNIHRRFSLTLYTGFAADGRQVTALASATQCTSRIGVYS